MTDERSFPDISHSNITNEKIYKFILDVGEPKWSTIESDAILGSTDQLEAKRTFVKRNQFR